MTQQFSEQFSWQKKKNNLVNIQNLGGMMDLAQNEGASYVQGHDEILGGLELG